MSCFTGYCCLIVLQVSELLLVLDQKKFSQNHRQIGYYTHTYTQLAGFYKQQPKSLEFGKFYYYKNSCSV